MRADPALIDIRTEPGFQPKWIFISVLKKGRSNLKRVVETILNFDENILLIWLQKQGRKNL